MEATEREDPDACRKIASSEPRNPALPPHWLRCMWVQDVPGRALRRCRKGEGHAPPHKYEPPE